MQPFNRKALPAPQPIAEEDAVEDGILLAEYASRLALKNRILVAVLAGGERYDPRAFEPEGKRVLVELARQMTDSAELAAQERAEAAEKAGKGDSMHDYHRADLDNLDLRENTARSVAAELLRRSDDADYLTGFVQTARDDAWHDLAAEIGHRLDLERGPSAVDARYLRTREQRMRQVRNIDLSKLAQQRMEY